LPQKGVPVLYPEKTGLKNIPQEACPEAER
jgi:hypothetical protein